MSAQLSISFDSCERRSRGADTSRAAHERIRPHKRGAQIAVLRYIAAQHERGATLKDYAKWASKTPNEVSGRVSEIRYAGLITKTSERRDGCAVYVVTGEGLEVLRGEDES